MISCSIDLSNECQNVCEFCLSKGNLDGQHLDFEIYLRLLASLHSMGVKSIVFSGGGEPLLHPGFKEFIISAKEYGFKLGLFTNGIELDKYLDLVSDFTFIKISLDAGSRQSYRKIKGSDSFNKVVQNIIKATGKTFINIGFILMPENAHELFDVEYLLSGVDTISIKRDVHKYPRIPTAGSCKISGDLGIVTADARVYYCSLKRWNSDYLLGNLEVDNMVDIWKSRDEMDITKCFDCRHSTIKHEGFV